ncbi:class I glutamine amidotransferase-like protein [Dendrothele bispora CBS 962.96]|uniref:Class I glutamine amidotransferase-like protein n=1 Tax=Dendrothele bispora (strain CBS 962.96) TaxID=1314807 RepID=A0A4S8M8C9_DENBC|nr:class I glutamine amidotransferase-like protein [Dendrothele bispora CBS 962.96]
MSTPAHIKTIYKMAVCIYPEVTMLDFQGPVELLSSFSIDNQRNYGYLYPKLPDCAIETDFLSHSMEPIRPLTGPAILPTKTYNEVMNSDQPVFDLILIPGGVKANVRHVDPSLVEFLKKQGPKAKHILTVCTGSWILAGSGLLDGKRATTNKALYKQVVEDTKDHNIEWIPKARWVVNDDKKIWTSSGVTAGQDLAGAFLEYLIGKEYAEMVRGIIELGTKEQGDDEFATYYGLV